MGSDNPSLPPSIAPSKTPTLVFSLSPTMVPTVLPSSVPTLFPTNRFSTPPSAIESYNPTLSIKPSMNPTLSFKPTRYMPSVAPSVSPSIDFTIIDECYNFLSVDDEEGLECITNDMTHEFIVCYNAHSLLPSVTPSISSIPTTSPYPTVTASLSPTASNIPSIFPTSSPSDSPTTIPTSYPTLAPTDSPSSPPTSHAPSGSPTLFPSVVPTSQPSVVPTNQPSDRPSFSPTLSSSPSESPTVVSSMTPTESAAPTICADYPDLFEFQPVDKKNSKSIFCNEIREKESDYFKYKFDDRCKVKKVARKCRMRCGVGGLIALNPTLSPTSFPTHPTSSCKDSRKVFIGNFKNVREELTCKVLYKMKDAEKFKVMCETYAFNICRTTCDSCPSSAPSDTPTVAPSTVPTVRNSMLPSLSVMPSAEPSTSSKPSISSLPSTKKPSVSSAPTESSVPSLEPSISAEPTVLPSMPPSFAPTKCSNSKKTISYEDNGINKEVRCSDISKWTITVLPSGIELYVVDKRCTKFKRIEKLCRKKCAMCL